MIFEGKAVCVQEQGSGIFELVFDLQGESVNKLSQQAVTELREAVEALKARDDLKGLLLTSGKESFIVGADIGEFAGMFQRPEDEILAALQQVHATFNAIEDLDCPTVVAINGLALGGGFELCLSADYRVMAAGAKVGLPEVKLGIYPGWGGTVRLSRLIGADNAIEWIGAGKEKRAQAALHDGAVDVVVEPAQLREAALDLLHECIAGRLDYRAKRQEKLDKLKLGQIDAMMAFETAKGYIAGKAGPHYPAPLAVVKVMQKHAGMNREQAQAVEAKGVVKLAKGPVCSNLVGLFMNDQLLKKKAQQSRPEAAEVKQAAVLGAGIMGGGIAYQSASRGTPILMKDIAEPALQLGLDEAGKLLGKKVEKGRMSAAEMAGVMGRIRPTLSYGDFQSVDLVVEAVVENPDVKDKVLAEVEQQVGADTVLTSNTSTISITQLSRALKRPENFCGMHFFNPVHKMPLVEVIRGEHTSERAVATTVAYAQAMGKTPIVVNDCPGFLVNRVLFPYFAGFNALVQQGVDFQRIDKVMEKFGWPMGPAHLIDVVGMDTAVHAGQVMAQGFPKRMANEGQTPMELLYGHKRLGQKNGQGFYRYETDKKGKPRKVADPEVYELLKPVVTEQVELSDEEIIERMMTPLCIETVRCLEEGIVATAAEADMGLIYGIGFPPFRGGALRYIDSIGLDAFCRQADKYADLGPLYQPTRGLREMASAGKAFFG